MVLKATTQKQSSTQSLIKGALSGLKQFLAAESPLKMIKNVFLFHVKISFRSQDN